jgi:hypothetical protein
MGAAKHDDYLLLEKLKPIELFDQTAEKSASLQQELHEFLYGTLIEAVLSNLEFLILLWPTILSDGAFFLTFFVKGQKFF